nr:immunoglobulin heavy chain junction region [Mus musculus]
CARHEEGFDYW